MFAEDAQRLEIIDKLHALRIDQYVDLPMLVVVGDQSSGKSSVLEALTELPFPRDSTLCTRFPTHIVFRRDPTPRFLASIHPYGKVDPEKQKGILGFTTTFESVPLPMNPDVFTDVLSAAAQCMGLSMLGGEKSQDQAALSRDVLKIELSGPGREHFSVIDLPGLFRSPTIGQTTESDISMVHDIVQEYIHNKRSIIMAVAGANVDIATQEIVRMANDADPTHSRTLGVFTKPDLVDDGAEPKIMDIINDSSKDGGLGYVVLCNRSQKDINTPLAVRNSRETDYFQSTPPWKALPKDRVGIKSLKLRLNALLVGLTRATFQQVSVEMTRQLSKTRDELSGMGRSRVEPFEQRLFLIELSSSSANLSAKAIDAYYSRDRCFQQNHELRLATRIRSAHIEYSRTFAAQGGHFSFSPRLSRRPLYLSPAKEEDLTAAESNADYEGDSENDDSDVASLPSENHSAPEDQVAINDLLESDLEPLPIRNRGGALAWIRQTYHETKGFEIGAINPGVLPTLFTHQTSAWAALSISHVRRIIKIIDHFLKILLDHLCPDPTIVDRLWVRLRPRLIEGYKRAHEHTLFLTKAEREGNLITLNHYFASNVDKLRQERLVNRLGKARSWVDPVGSEPLIALRDAQSALKSNEDETIEDLFDTLKSFYKVVRKRYVDAVCVQAIDYHLLSSRESPLRLFSPAYVGAMSDDELRGIAGETNESRKRRAALNDKVEALQAGLNVCASFEYGV